MREIGVPTIARDEDCSNRFIVRISASGHCYIDALSIQYLYTGSELAFPPKAFRGWENRTLKTINRCSRSLNRQCPYTANKFMCTKHGYLGQRCFDIANISKQPTKFASPSGPLYQVRRLASLMFSTLHACLLLYHNDFQSDYNRAGL